MQPLVRLERGGGSPENGLTAARQPTGRQYVYMQAVRVGDRIECSGQAVKAAGTRRLASSHMTSMRRLTSLSRISTARSRVREARVPSRSTASTATMSRSTKRFKAVMRNLQKWLPNYKPIWTCVGVARLALDEMLVEIEVVAYDPQD